jgi:hypothetical protein
MTPPLRVWAKTVFWLLVFYAVIFFTGFYLGSALRAIDGVGDNVTKFQSMSRWRYFR